MPYDIVQLRWGEDSRFETPVKDQTGYRLPVKISEFDGDLVVNTTISDTITIDDTDINQTITTAGADQSVLLTAILIELRVISSLLKAGLNVDDELNQLRDEPENAQL